MMPPSVSRSLLSGPPRRTSKSKSFSLAKPHALPDVVRFFYLPKNDPRSDRQGAFLSLQTRVVWCCSFSLHVCGPKSTHIASPVLVFLSLTPFLRLCAALYAPANSTAHDLAYLVCLAPTDRVILHTDPASLLALTGPCMRVSAACLPVSLGRVPSAPRVPTLRMCSRLPTLLRSSWL